MMATDTNSTSPNRALAGKRTLVIGGGGFLGSHLVERLIESGAVVGALARRRGKLAGICEGARCVFMACDLHDAEQTRRAVAGFAPQIVFHLAARPDANEDFNQARAAIETNLIGTLNALEAFRLCDGELFIYGDSVKVYGDGGAPYRSAMPLRPLSSYAIARAAGWQLCELYRRVHGLAVVSVRPTLIYGPRQGHNLISFVVDSTLARSGEIRLDGGDQTRDPLFIDDAGEAFLAVAARGAQLAGSIVNIGGGEERTVAEIARLIVELMGGDTPVVINPQRRRPTETQRSYCDNVEAAVWLGWQPRTDLRAGLRETITYLLRQRAEESRPFGHTDDRAALNVFSLGERNAARTKVS